jgi:hypothetical protein
MMKQQPDGWLRYLKEYATSDLIITDLLGDNDRSNMIHSVLLKQLNFCSDNNYFVRPGQHLSANKFNSVNHYFVYCCIKVLKAILEVDISQYLVKKMLLRPSEFSGGVRYSLLYATMCQGELRERFEEKIDYDQWKKEEFKSNIPLKKLRIRRRRKNYVK